MHKEEFDFCRLRKANDLLLKWSLRFSVHKYDFLRFCFKLQSEMEFKKLQLPVNMRGQFAKDCKSMFYASEIEEALVSQYIPMIHSIVKKFSVLPDQYEDHISEGLMAVRCAVWHFRTHKNKATFITFCHSSISKRIKWYRSKIFKKSSRRNSKCKIVLTSDLPSEMNIDAIKLTNEEYHENVFCSNIIDGLIKACGLSDEDKFLIESYIKREDLSECWYRKYNETYTPKTRQGIHYQLNKIQQRVFRVMRKSDLIPEGYTIPDRTRR